MIECKCGQSFHSVSKWGIHARTDRPTPIKERREFDSLHSPTVVVTPSTGRVLTNHIDIADSYQSLRNIQRSLESHYADIQILEIERDRLLSNLEPQPIKVIDWVKVHQSAPCWRCYRTTEWRNPNGAPEHHLSNCPNLPGGMTFKLGKLFDGLLDGSINPDEYLK